MIWKFKYGHPFETEAVAEHIKETEEAPPLGNRPKFCSPAITMKLWAPYRDCVLSIWCVADGYRANHIPIDMLYMDIDYMQDFKDFTINGEEFVDFPAFVKEMKERNIRLIPIMLLPMIFRNCFTTS